MTAKQTPEAATVESMEEIESTIDVEYATIQGFREGQTLEIGSLSAGDMIEFSEANEGEAKRTAGLRLICKSLVSSEKTGRVRYASDNKNIDVFRKKSHRTTERVVREILKLNGIELKGDAKAEERAKND